MSAAGRDGGLGGLTNVILTATIMFIILFIGISVISPVISSTTDGDGNVGTQDVTTSVELEGAGTYVDVPGPANSGRNETVYDSRGYAVQFAAGNESYVEADQEIDLSSGGNWTVSVWGSLNSSATADETRALVNLDGQLMVVHNDTSDEWVAYYYDEGSRNGANVSVAAPNQPGSLTNIQVVRAGDQLTIYRNTTAGETATVPDGGPFEAPINTTDWHGRLEELRVYDDALDSSTRSDLYTDPNGPTTGNNQTARVMFDEPYRDSQRIYYSSANLQQYNVTFVQGHPGQELDEGDFSVAGADYEWDPEGPRLKPISDGVVTGARLDGAPVAYVDYTSANLESRGLTAQFTSALLLAGLVPVIVVLGYIVTTFSGVRGGRSR